MGTEAKTSIGFVGTFPPRVCGIASYTGSLVSAINDGRRRIGVVALNQGPSPTHGAPVVFRHLVGNSSSRQAATRILNTFDAVSIQHEYGIYGGPDGEEVLDFLEEVVPPISVTLHTVLSAPSSRQRMILGRIGDRADNVIVMSHTASGRLVDKYGFDADRISVIPHGADRTFAGTSLASGSRPLVLTWGLIGPGKGLEWAIEAFAGLRDLRPLPRYLIAGASHPNVVRDSGESYRDGLITLTRRLDVGGIVEFRNRYLDRADLARMVRSADLVVLPYQSAEQVTSGVLVEAIAASKPVVATAFPHAVELLSGGAGVVVPHGDTLALRGALRGLLTQPASIGLMTRRAGLLAQEWYWPTIGRSFAKTMDDLAGATTGPLLTDQRVAG